MPIPHGPSRDKFILHWLEDSRAQRVLFVLVTLDLDWDVKIYFRNPETYRGPKELFKVHPSGKSPILEIHPADGSPSITLAESGAIIQYLTGHYDPHNILTPTNPREQIQVDYFLHYTEGTLQHLLVSLLINSVAKKVAPRGFKTVVRLVTKGLNNGYYAQEYLLNLNLLEKHLEKQGTGYFVGNKLTAADIMLTFPLYENLFDNEEGVKEITGIKTDLFKTYPHIAAWAIMIREHPVYNNINEIMEDKVAAYVKAVAQKKNKYQRKSSSS